MEKVFAIPELVTNIGRQGLSLPVRNRDVRWLLEIMSVSKQFSSACEMVLSEMEIVPAGILHRIPRTKIGFSKFSRIRSFSMDQCPWLNDEILACMKNLQSLTLTLVSENEINPSLLLSLTNLQTLDIKSWSGTFGLLQIPLLTNLTNLNLRFTRARNTDLQGLTNLTLLDFENAPHIHNSLFTVLTKLTNLSVGNDLDRLGPSPPLNTKLQQLAIFGDDRPIQKMDLWKFPELTKLDLVSVTESEGLEKLSSLKILYIQLNARSQKLYDTVPLLTNLTELRLSCSQKPLIDANHILPSLKLLEKLYLCGAGISNSTLKEVTSLTNLTIIHNDDISNEGIKQLTNLVKLTLRDCPRISSRGISRLTNLQVLQIFNIGFIDESILNLTKLRAITFPEEKRSLRLDQLLDLPNLEIVHYSGDELDEVKKRLWQNSIFISTPRRNTGRLKNL